MKERKKESRWRRWFKLWDRNWDKRELKRLDYKYNYDGIKERHL